MKLFRLGVAFAVVSLGCQDPEYGGEKGTLRLRFGLGGCTFVPAAKGTLARGGSTDVLVTDNKDKRTTLNVTSASPGVVLAQKATLELTCDSSCKETNGTLPVAAVSTGSGRIVFTDESGTEVDALALTVSEVTGLSVEDGEGRSSASITTSKAGQLRAKLRGPDGEVFAKTPFTWTVEGEVLKPITSKDSVVTVEANSTGTSLVNVRFGDVAGSIEVRVSN